MDLNECVLELMEMVETETISNGTLIRVTARSKKGDESARIANVVVSTRGEIHQKRFRLGLKDQEAGMVSNVENLDRACAEKRLALRDALGAAHLLPEFVNEASLKALCLTDELKRLRDEWAIDCDALAQAKQTLSSLKSSSAVPEYAEIIEKAVPSLTPQSPDVTSRAVKGLVFGAAAGFLLSLFGGFIFGQLRRK